MSYQTINPTIDSYQLLSAKASERESRKLSQAELDSRTRYVYNPGRNLYLGDRRIGMKHLFRVRLNPTNNWFSPQETYRKYEENGPMLEQVPTYAAWIAEELATIYAARFVTIIDSFTGLPQQLVIKIEQMLIPSDRFPTTTPKLLRILDVLKISLLQDSVLLEGLKELGHQYNVTNVVELTIDAVNAMSDATAQAFVYQTAQLDTAITERQNPEQSGKTFYDVADKEMAQLLERENDLVEKPNMLDALNGIAEGMRGGVGKSNESQPREDNRPRRSCPSCAEKILIQAKKCRFCGEYFGKEDENKE